MVFQWVALKTSYTLVKKAKSVSDKSAREKLEEARKRQDYSLLFHTTGARGG